MENRDRGFKRKTIVSIISNKMNAWINTLPESLQGRVKNSYILTGGAIASLVQGQMPNDYDVYFDDVDVCAAVAQHYVDMHKINTSMRVEVQKLNHQVKVMIKSAGVIGDEINDGSYQYFEQSPEESVSEEMANFLGNPDKADLPTDAGKYRASFITSNAISLTDSVQIITRFVGDAAEIHKNFDYVHATNYYSVKTGLVLNQDALESIICKELQYVGSLYPIASLFRMRKFIGRGWTINVGEILKISWDISKLNLEDYTILQEQLTGVDVAYFNQLLTLLKDSDRTLDRSYLVELINRIFD